MPTQCSLCALRRIGLKHTQFAEATCGTIRLKLLKSGTLVRGITVAMASGCPYRPDYAVPSPEPRPLQPHKTCPEPPTPPDAEDRACAAPNPKASQRQQGE